MASRFARYQGESKHPELWVSLEGAWIPFLGPTGLNLFDQGGKRRNGTTVGATWVTNRLIYDTAGDVTTLPATNDLGNDGAFSFAMKLIHQGDGIGTSFGRYFEIDSDNLLFTDGGSIRGKAKGGQAGVREVESTTTLSAGDLVTIVFSSNGFGLGGLGLQLWVNGVLEDNNTLGRGFDNAAVLIANNPALNRTAEMELFGLYRWSKNLAPNEIGLLQEDFFAPFRLKSNVGFVAAEDGIPEVSGINTGTLLTLGVG